MPGSLRTGATFAALACCLGYMPQKDRIAELRSRFEHEPDAVNKAKLMPNLAAAEFHEIQKSISAGDAVAALATLEKYRDETRACATELDSKAIDAEKHPAGFKQLQVSLRQSLRRLEDVVVSLPNDEQAPFVKVRDDLEQLDRHLIRELFPHQPGGEAEKSKK